MTAWRAIQTKPLLEQIAGHALTEIGVPNFLPRRTIRLHRRGSPVAMRAYFPGYVFGDLERAHVYDVRRCRGVVAILGTQPLPDIMIDTLLARTDEQGRIVDPLEPGKFYRLDRPGALANVIAKVERIDERNRASVLIHFLGLDRTMIVATQDLMGDPLPAPSAQA